MRAFLTAPAALLAAGLSLLAACGGDITSPAPDAAAAAPLLSLGLPNNATADTLLVGETVQLTASLRSPGKKVRTTTWTSSAPAVASVSATGLVTAVAPGTATVTASNGSTSESATIVVRAPGGTETPPPPTTSPAPSIVLALMGPTRSVSDVEARGGVFARYEQDFRTYIESHWKSEGAAYTANYYDRAAIYYQWWARTGNATYYDRATAMVLEYRRNFVEARNYAVEPNDAQLDGLALHYLLAGDEASRTAVGRLADRYATPWYYDNLGNLNADMESRMQARALLSFLLAWYIKAPSAAGNDWATRLRGALTKILSAQAADGAYRWSGQCKYNKPFMVGMLNDALTRYHALFEQDSRILPSVKLAVDYMWAKNWLSGAQSFNYIEGNCNGEVPGESPDLNNLIVTGFGWVGKMTGDATYFTRGDAVFTGGVTQAYLGGSKQFNQNYITSPRYFGTRF